MPSKNKVFTQPVKRAGKSVQDKLSSIRAKVQEAGTTAHIISSLDDVAWTLNLRGNDVNANPVFLGYIYLSLNDAVLFVDLEKLETDAKEQLDKSDVKAVSYHDFFNFLSGIDGIGRAHV